MTARPRAEPRTTSRESAKIIGVFLLCFAVVNGALLALHRRDVKHELEQIREATRRYVLNGDPGSAEEFLHSLEPNFIRDYKLSTDVNPPAEDRMRARFPYRIPLFFDRNGTALAGEVGVELQEGSFHMMLVAVNAILIGLMIFGLIIVRRYTKLLLQFEVEFFS